MFDIIHQFDQRNPKRKKKKKNEEGAIDCACDTSTCMIYNPKIPKDAKTQNEAKAGNSVIAPSISNKITQFIIIYCF